MKDYDKAIKFSFNKPLSEAEISKLQQKLNGVDGIDSFEISGEHIRIEYLPFKLSKETIKNKLKEFGYTAKPEKTKRKGLFTRFIDNLSKSNKEVFGNKKLDCCDLKDKDLNQKD